MVAVAALSVAGVALAKGGPQSVVTPSESVQWSAAGVPGVSTAAVQGDMAKGPSHFYLKYAAGFVAPPHHHSPDHYVTVVSGTILLTVDGKEHRLTPGSYFALLGKAVHSAKVEGDQDCVMFVDARGPWDLVLEKTAAKP
jgi:mannose-6-phosphate isomerase-like protein (cupin superfamily)